MACRNIVSSTESIALLVKDVVGSFKSSDVNLVKQGLEDVMKESELLLQRAQNLLKRLSPFREYLKDQECEVIKKVNKISELKNEIRLNVSELEEKKRKFQREVDATNSRIRDLENERLRQKEIREYHEREVDRARDTWLPGINFFKVLINGNAPKMRDALSKELDAALEIDSLRNTLDCNEKNLNSAKRYLSDVEAQLRQVENVQQEINKRHKGVTDAIVDLSNEILFIKEFLSHINNAFSTTDVLSDLMEDMSISELQSRGSKSAMKTYEEKWNDVKKYINSIEQEFKSYSYTCIFCGEKFSGIPFMLPSSKPCCETCHNRCIIL